MCVRVRVCMCACMFAHVCVRVRTRVCVCVSRVGVHPEICSLLMIISSQHRSQDGRVRKATSLPFLPETGESPQADNLILRMGNQGQENSVQMALVRTSLLPPQPPTDSSDLSTWPPCPSWHKTSRICLECGSSFPYEGSRGMPNLHQTNVSACLCSFDFGSVAQPCPTFCDPMNRSMPGLPVCHQLPEFTQTHVHQVGDAIQPSHPLSSPSPPAPNPSQHEGLFQ